MVVFLAPAHAMPKVSVGLPVYNGEPYLQDAIRAILSQSLRDFELVISDNGSTDRTAEICAEFARQDSRIRYYRQDENHGAIWNFNETFRLSTGEYFRWAAHDDLTRPTHLERCCAVLDSDPGCVLVYPQTVVIDQSGKEAGTYSDFLATPDGDPVAQFEHWMLGRPIGMCNPIFGLFRARVIRETGLFGSFIACDRVFLGRIALAGRVRCIPEPLFQRRWHPGVSTQAHRDTLALERWHTGRPAHGLRFVNFRLLREFCAMALQAKSLSHGDRARALGIVLRWAWQIRRKLRREIALPLFLNGRETAFYRSLKPYLRRDHHAGRPAAPPGDGPASHTDEQTRDAA